MVQITIQIDGDKVAINQSAAPTKVENSATKRYFIVIAHCDKLSWVELVTENSMELSIKDTVTGMFSIFTITDIEVK